MDNTQAKLGNALLKSLVGLREKKGDVRIEDVGALLMDMAKSLPHGSETDAFIRNELERMSREIANGKRELLDLMHGEDAKRKHLGQASQQLGAVVKHTEEATNIIMDSVDEIQEAVGKVDPDLESRVAAASARIYEACNFQDITGQRITKVLDALEHIEQKIARLAALFGGQEIAPGAGQGAPAAATEDESHLLNGPQLPGEAPSQQEIDKMFASLK